MLAPLFSGWPAGLMSNRCSRRAGAPGAGQTRLRGVDRRSVRHPSGLRRPDPDLRRRAPVRQASRAGQPSVRLDLGGGDRGSVRAATGRNPVRPHMILFNSEHTHAVLSFVASGHVVIFDAESRKPLQCFETTVGSDRHPPGACGLPGPGRLVHPGREPERQTARAHRHQLRDQHLRAQPRRHAGSGDVHDAERAAVRASGHAADQLADLPDHRLEQHLRVRHAARRRAVRRQRQDDADVDRRRVRQGDGERERLRRHRGGGHMYINSGGSPVNVSGTDPHHPGALRVRRLPVPAGRLLVGRTAEHARARAAAVEDRACPTRTAWSRPPGRLSLGDGSPRQRRGDHRPARRASG